MEFQIKDRTIVFNKVVFPYQWKSAHHSEVFESNMGLINDWLSEDDTDIAEKLEAWYIYCLDQIESIKSDLIDPTSFWLSCRTSIASELPDLFKALRHFLQHTHQVYGLDKILDQKSLSEQVTLDKVFVREDYLDIYAVVLVNTLFQPLFDMLPSCFKVDEEWRRGQFIDLVVWTESKCSVLNKLRNYIQALATVCNNKSLGLKALDKLYFTVLAVCIGNDIDIQGSEASDIITKLTLSIRTRVFNHSTVTGN